MSLTITSKLNQGKVVADLELPTRNLAKQTLLRIRVPDGWRVTGASAGSRPISVDDRGTMDISALKGKCNVVCAVRRL